MSVRDDAMFAGDAARRHSGITEIALSGRLAQRTMKYAVQLAGSRLPNDR
ncbi:MAG TPA: hypothetical protein VLF40_04215 [Candidatus Saccharimonadales bacterium]|nr:hypothetical protein [Candidatus Saccharimonadales bacterium]